jgi:hypothetical protein
MATAVLGPPWLCRAVLVGASLAFALCAGIAFATARRVQRINEEIGIE